MSFARDLIHDYGKLSDRVATLERIAYVLAAHIVQSPTYETADDELRAAVAYALPPAVAKCAASGCPHQRRNDTGGTHCIRCGAKVTP